MSLAKSTIGFTALAVVALVASACSPAATTAPSGSTGSGDRAGISIEVVTHGQASDPFWSIFKNGVDQGGKDMGVKVTYSAPDTFDMVKMGQLIDAACAKKPSGLVISLPDATALGPSVTKCVTAGIPVISANSGSDAFAALGILTHVGQEESVAGKAAGVRMAAAGGKNAICVNQEVGNAALDARCNGFAEGFAPGKSTVLQVDLKDPTTAQQKIAAALTADPTIDTVMALGPTGSTPTIAALKQMGNATIKVGTFDLSKDVLDAISAGTMLFAIDQQQYLQGYLPITFLTLYNLYGLMPGGGQPVYTGPGFVTKDNVATVQANTGTTR
ncbi:MAG: sugar ABC transporter substrate-binding protein [Candidatus Limnocylindrales bacterium]